MGTGESTPLQDAPTRERRRARRFSLVVPVEVEWIDLAGVGFKEEARARNVNDHGALLHMKKYPRLNSEVVLKNCLTRESKQARLTGIRRGKAGELLGVIVELLVPSETFWGLTFQLQRSTAELLEIERALQSRDIDFRVLRELRGAVEYLRETASAVHQWQDLQLEGGDAYSVLPVVTEVRLRRAGQLFDELASDLDAMEVTDSNEGLDGVALAVDRLYKRLARRAVTLKASGAPRCEPSGIGFRVPPD